MKVRNIVTFYPLSDEDQEVLMKELQHEEMLARLPEEYRKLKEYCEELTAKYNTLQEQNQILGLWRNRSHSHFPHHNIAILML